MKTRNPPPPTPSLPYSPKPFLMNDKDSHRPSVLQSAYATLTRPTTAAMVKMLSKIAPLYSGATTTRKIRASDLQKLIEKVHKHQNKVDLANQALLKAFDMWGAELPHPENALVVREFADLLDCVNVVYAAQADRLNILKVHLGAIATREARQHELLEKHTQLQRKFDAAAMKHGPRAAQTSLYLDQIEENEYNLKLIEQQLVRIASSSLREACTEYLLWLQGSIVSMTRSCNGFLATLRDTDPSATRRATGFNSGVSRGGPSIPEGRIEEEMPLERGEKSGDRRIREEKDLHEKDRYQESHYQEREGPCQKENHDWAAYDIRRYERNQEGWG